MSGVLDWFLYVDVFIYLCMIIMVWLLISAPNQDRDDRWLSATIILYGINDVITSVMAYNDMNNLWLYNLVLFPQFILVLTILIRKIRNATISTVLTGGG